MNREDLFTTTTKVFFYSSKLLQLGINCPKQRFATIFAQQMYVSLENLHDTCLISRHKMHLHNKTLILVESMANNGMRYMVATAKEAHLVLPIITITMCFFPLILLPLAKVYSLSQFLNIANLKLKTQIHKNFLTNLFIYLRIHANRIHVNDSQQL